MTHGTAHRLLVVTAVEREREVVGEHPGVFVLAGGIGRTNAAAATTEAILRHGPFAGVICAGIAGALPASDGGDMPLPGTVVMATCCVYVEEGLAAPDGFHDLRTIRPGGFRLGDFEGNVVPVDEAMLGTAVGHLEPALGSGLVVAPVATVATCSGTDDAAREVVRRTRLMAGAEAAAEAMEGAAVVHAARRLGVPGLEIRSISNSTGHRARQHWDMDAAFSALGVAMRLALTALRPGGRGA